jgi:Flp pilus assembly protein TadG
MTMVRLSSLLRRFARASDGAAAIEFALIVPVFMLFCMGIIEGGRMMWIRNSIQTATEEAGRFAMAHTTATDAELVTHAADYFDSVGIDNPTFTVVRDTAGSMDFVTITGAYSFQYLFSFFDFGNVELDGKARVPLVS